MKNKRNVDPENKTELAKSIAKGSKSFKRTYTNIEQRIQKVFRFLSSGVDRVLFNDRYAKLVAVCLASVVCLIVSSGAEGNIFTNSMKSAIDLDEIKVVSNASNSIYEITGLPETVDVTISGDTGDVQYASQQKGNYQIQANLKDVGEGTHEVALEPLNFPNKVDVMIKPNTAIVTVKKKVSRSFILSYDFINMGKMDKKYSLSKPEFAQNEVIIRASEETMAEISYVKALIDVDGVKADFEQESEIVAYNNAGDKLKVDIVPQKVGVKVGVTTPNKEVPIVIVPKGELEDNKAIASYILDTEMITLYGPNEVLDDIDQIEVVIPVNKIVKNDTTITMPIMLPSGVSTASVSKVNVTIKLTKSSEQVFDLVPVNFKNLDSKLKVTNFDEVSSVSVKAIGAKEVLDTIKVSDIEVSVDLGSYSDYGSYKVVYTVKGKPSIVLFKIEKDEVNITLGKGD